jgi:hypothetical protein
VKNILIRLAELIQEGLSEDLLTAFKSSEPLPLDERLALIGKAIDLHQERAETLWLKAGGKRTPEERRASAQAELASFVFAYLTGDATEYADSAMEALQTLGRQSEIDLITGLCSK